MHAAENWEKEDQAGNIMLHSDLFDVLPFWNKI